MKTICLKLIALFTLLSSTTAVYECILGVRVYPFKFISSTETVEFKVAFKSTCMDFPSINFFILPYDRDFELTKAVHPTRIILNIFGRVYQFDFTKRVKVVDDGLDNVEYQRVRVLPSKVPQRVDVTEPNDIILRTSIANAFSKDEVDGVYYKKNPCYCKLSKSKKTLYCQI